MDASAVYGTPSARGRYGYISALLTATTQELAAGLVEGTPYVRYSGSAAFDALKAVNVNGYDSEPLEPSGRPVHEAGVSRRPSTAAMACDDARRSAVVHARANIVKY